MTIHHSKYILRRQYITYREGQFRGRIQNNLYAPKLFPAILTNHLATVPLWSGLLLGDLSEHGESKDYENFAQHLEHIHMRPEVNSNRFEISLRDKISLRCEVTSLSAFTWLRAEWNSLRCKFHFGQVDQSEITVVSFPCKQ